MAPRNPSSIVKGTGDFDIELALGRLITNDRAPLISIGQFGHNAAVGTTLGAIWSPSVDVTWLEAPEFMRIRAGGDVADDITGAGARQVIITGIGEDFKIQKEILTTAGIAASATTTKKFWRIWQITVLEVGVYGGTNADIITLESVDTTVDMGEVESGQCVSRMGIFSTPDDHTGILRQLLISAEGNKLVDFSMHRRLNFPNVSSPLSPFNIIRQLDGEEGINIITFHSDPVLPPLTDFFMGGMVSAGTAKVSVLMDFTLVPIR